MSVKYDICDASDESSESDFLDQSLSVWRGWTVYEKEAGFSPTPIDIFTASSLGLYSSVLHNLKSCNVNNQNVSGWTALMYASYIGHVDIVDVLLRENALTDISNKKKRTALMLASSCGNQSVTHRLLEAGSNMELIDESGWTALYHSTHYGHQSVVKFLLSRGAKTNIVERHMGMTPFMEAAIQGHEIIVQEFLNYNVDISIRNKQGETARSLALLKGFTKVVSLIDNHLYANQRPLRSRPGLGRSIDTSSSEESLYEQRQYNRPRSKLKAVPNIGEGPEAVQRLLNNMDPINSLGLQFSNLLTNPDNLTYNYLSENPDVIPKVSDNDKQPKDLREFLTDMNLLKYLPTFEEQDVDLTVFLSLNDDDLKELGVKLLGPRRKMINAIKRLQNNSDEHVLSPFVSDTLLAKNRLRIAERQIAELRDALSKENQLRAISENCLMDVKQRCSDLQKFPSALYEQIKDIRSYYSQMCLYQQELCSRNTAGSDKSVVQLSNLSNQQLIDSLVSISSHVGGLIEKLYHSKGFIVASNYS
ncbi:DgyrCDS566 [Dimorphilus gyrociliatus]|uniref:DgyrCDS566 n=1 Tax=Dimorphilus gyrociliatus TaxID=2664684 RepID=A0A7I8V4U4_9ANNE|nr:DgyrCDS566 [Dimorphilus gyrociliatus]